jgi:shikimate kinase
MDRFFTPKNIFLAAMAAALLLHDVAAFSPVLRQKQHPMSVLSTPPQTCVFAGGFEWEDPTESFDQGIENPFKNPDLTLRKEGDETMKIDPARLLGPRLNGANLYFIGMMGTGKSIVGDIVARRE